MGSGGGGDGRVHRDGDLLLAEEGLLEAARRRAGRDDGGDGRDATRADVVEVEHALDGRALVVVDYRGGGGGKETRRRRRRRGADHCAARCRRGDDDDGSGRQAGCGRTSKDG